MSDVSAELTELKTKVYLPSSYDAVAKRFYELVQALHA